MADTPRPAASILSVSELNRMAREVLEGSFALLWVAGEVSNLTRAASGHWYFSLKDDRAQVRCVMFRNRNAALDWQPREGDHVEARALVTIYEARGDFQINIEALQKAGQGALFEAFERLKSRLQAEGLFDAARKRPLPDHPRQIGIVTSPDAAALHDVLTTLRRRAPGIPIVIYPSPVQGKGAAELIAQTIRHAGQRAECDVLLVCRGGGSLEDLWSFNEECVARAIVASPIPIVSGVGHETDFTIADFAADLRAPTPTAAAELVAPDRQILLQKVAEATLHLQRQMRHRLNACIQQLDYLARCLTHPGQVLHQKGLWLTQAGHRLDAGMARALERGNTRLSPLPSRLQNARERQFALRHETLQRLRQSLLHLGPQAVLERGYSLVQKSDGSLVRHSRELHPGERLQLHFAQGQAEAGVIATKDPVSR